MQVQVQSIICGSELNIPLPHAIGNAVFYNLKEFAVMKVDDKFVVGTPIDYMDMSEYTQPPETWRYNRPLPKPGGSWKYVFGIFPSHEQAKGLFDMLESFRDEGISTFYPQFYDAETGEYNLPHELEWELDKQRLQAIEDSLPVEQSVASA